MRRRLSVALLAVVLLALASVSSAGTTVQQVLVLHSLERGNISTDYFHSRFRTDLDQRLGAPVSVVELVVSPAGFTTPPEEAIVEYLLTAFADRPQPALIVTIGGSAAAFARKHRSRLFPQAPVLFAALDQRFLREAPLADNETAVAVINDIPRLVGDILYLFPRTSHVFMVTGSEQLGKFWRNELERDFRQFQGKLTFIWSDDQSLAEILKNVAKLPPDSAIVYIAFGTDVQGGAYADERVLAELSANASAPLFGTQSAQLGHGIVGGTLMANDDLGRRAVDVAIRILNGESPANVRVAPQPAGPTVFDGRVLERWGIAENRLPPGSSVRLRGPSLWRDYRAEVLTGVVGLLAQSLLIVGLLYQRRARRRAEFESRRSLSIAADANRRVTMSALTGSIAHDLSQPLNSILHNAKAAELLLDSHRATPETLREILSDIRDADLRATEIIARQRSMLRNHHFEKKPVDVHAVVRESIALVSHDASVRQIRLDAILPSEPCYVAGDQVLLQQVLVNLLMNAMEAMSETARDRRVVRLENRVGQDGVVVLVRDAGTGLPPAVNGQLFAPYITTKENGMGIGLTIARTIVEAHDGRLEGRNNPEGGATFSVTLPCMRTQ